MLLRATFLFGEDRAGWSETYYKDASDLTALRGKLKSLITGRLAVLHKTVEFIGVRLSVPGFFRDSRFIASDVTYASVPGSPFPAIGQFINGTNAVEPDVALLFRLEAGDFHRRPLLLRGIPETVIGTSVPPGLNRYNPSALNWNAAQDKFRKALLGTGTAAADGPWQLRGIDSTQPFAPVTAVTVGLSGLLNIFTVLPGPLQKNTAVPPAVSLSPLVPGDIVQIGRAKGSVGLNGFWQVIAPIPTAAPWDYRVIPHSRITASPFGSTPPIGTRVRAVRYIGQDIDSVADERIVDRKTGRPFGLSAGRRRVRL